MDSGSSKSIAEIVAGNDLNELIRAINAACARDDWDALVEIGERCERAIERGFQLWPAAHHAAYRLALEAPSEWAGEVVIDGAAKFAPGPLSEVVAQFHEWAELAPFIPEGPAGAFAMYERVLRGEDLTEFVLDEPDPLELPRVLQHWEPSYALAEYKSDGASFPSPPPPNFRSQPIAAPSKTFEDPESIGALLALVQGWRNSSRTVAQAVAVDGDAASCVAVIDPEVTRMAQISGSDAMAWMAWAASSGGATGRRRGGAIGRLDAWVAVAALAGFEEWPVEPDEIGAALSGFDWWCWEPSQPVSGWSLYLAVDDPDTGEAWAIGANDPGEVGDEAASNGIGEEAQF